MAVTSTRPPFAPPFLQAGRLVIGQTANILQFLGARHGLAPKHEGGRLWTQELQLTMADFLGEIHDTHHPVAVNLFYEDQKKEARRRAADFLKHRAPKYLGYFEQILRKNARGERYLVGAKLTYADLSMFQIMAGSERRKFLRAMAKVCPRKYRRLSSRLGSAECKNVRALLPTSLRRGVSLSTTRESSGTMPSSMPAEQTAVCGTSRIGRVPSSANSGFTGNES